MIPDTKGSDICSLFSLLIGDYSFPRPPPEDPMKGSRTRDRIIVLVSVFAFVTIILFIWIREKMAPEPIAPVRPVTVSAIRPELSDLYDTLVISATLDAEKTVAVVPRVPGTILEIVVEEGETVQKGDLLARIDSEPYILELQAAESAWLLAESSLLRVERLFSSSGASQQHLDEARANRDAAMSSYKLAKMRNDYAELRSPIDGVVMARYSDTGAMASTGFPLFTIGDDANPRIRIRLPEKHWDQFQNPDTVQVRISRFGDKAGSLQAKILRVSPGISPIDKTFEVVCALDPYSVHWPLGARLSVEFVLTERLDVWSLPARALNGKGSLWWVDSENLVARQQSDVNLYTDGSRIALPDEWSDRLFILDGHHRLKEGQAVLLYRGDLAYEAR